MKDQKKIIAKALENEVPAFALIGTDEFALQTIEFYRFLTLGKCSKEFSDDLLLLIQDFKDFRNQEPEKIRIPT
jgi:hypothetical protein